MSVAALERIAPDEAVLLGDPQSTVCALRESDRATARAKRDGSAELTVRVDFLELACIGLGEPQVVVRADNNGCRAAAGGGNRILVTVPVLIMTYPMALPLSSVNQMLPSGPATMPSGVLPAVTANCPTTWPSWRTARAILLLPVR